MSEKILVPTLGESVTEATVSKWLKSVGEKVDSDEPIVELETDKVNVEVPSPMSGVLEKINVQEGSTVEVGALLGSVNSKNVSTDEVIDNVKQYTPPLKDKIEEEKEVAIFDTPEKNKIKKKSSSLPSNGSDTLVLENIVEEPLILDKVMNEESDKSITKKRKHHHLQEN